MTTSSHHRIALALTGPLLAALAVDSVVRAATGDPTFVTDDSVGPPALGQIVNLVLAGAVLALHGVLRSERRTFAGVGRLARGSRLVLLLSLPLLATGLVVAGPMLRTLGIDSGPLYDASGLVAFVGLTVSGLAAATLGLTQVRHNELGVGGRLLPLLLPAGLMTVVLGLVAQPLASPVFVSACMLIGLATIGVGRVNRAPDVLAA